MQLNLLTSLVVLLIMRALILVWGLLLWSLTLAGQSYHVAGLVLDELNQPMPGCYVRSNGSAAVTDVNGRFIFNHLSKEELHLEVSFLGYLPFDTLLRADGHLHLRINLKPDAVNWPKGKWKAAACKPHQTKAAPWFRPWSWTDSTAAPWYAPSTARWVSTAWTLEPLPLSPLFGA